MEQRVLFLQVLRLWTRSATETLPLWRLLRQLPLRQLLPQRLFRSPRQCLCQPLQVVQNAAQMAHPIDMKNQCLDPPALCSSMHALTIISMMADSIPIMLWRALKRTGCLPRLCLTRLLLLI
jgi:hypothetical protein